MFSSSSSQWKVLQFLSWWAFDILNLTKVLFLFHCILLDRISHWLLLRMLLLLLVIVSKIIVHSCQRLLKGFILGRVDCISFPEFIQRSCTTEFFCDGEHMSTLHPYFVCSYCKNDLGVKQKQGETIWIWKSMLLYSSLLTDSECYPDHHEVKSGLSSF